MTSTPEQLEKKIHFLEEQNRILESNILEIYTLYKISKKLNMATQLEEIFTGTMDLIAKSLQIEDFCIMLFEGPDHRLVTSAFHGNDDDLKNVVFYKGEGISGKVALSGEISIIQDVAKNEDFLYYKDKKKNIGSFLCIPLKNKKSKVMGVLNAHKPIPNSFSDKDIELFKEVAKQISWAIDKALSFKQIRELSIKDSLTGLYNRRYFFEFVEKEFERSKRYQRFTSLVMIDVDHFKAYNDTFGHPNGDKALQYISDMLTTNLRKTDVLARYGGEEFIVLLPETGHEIAIDVAEKLRYAVAEGKFEGNRKNDPQNLTASFGVATYPNDADFVSELVDCADKALYHAKKYGRDKVVSFDVISGDSH